MQAAAGHVEGLCGETQNIRNRPLFILVITKQLRTPSHGHAIHLLRHLPNQKELNSTSGMKV